jgi:hypothetical protein
VPAIAASTTAAVEEDAATWAPDDAANLAIWLRADSGVTNASGDASGWADFRGSGLTLTQATSGRRPLIVASAQGGRPCVRFTSANTDILSVASGAPPQTGAHSIFLVGTFATTPASFRGMCGIGNNVKSSGIGHNGSAAAWFGGANLVTPTGAAVSSATVYRLGKTVAAESAGTSVTQGYRNGATDGSSSANAYGVSTSFTVGNYEDGITGCADVDIYEVVVYSRVLTGGEISDLNTYFAARYAL